MATKYFINGGVNNNYTDNTNWSTTSGGANDTTAPTSSDDVRLDGSSPNCVLNATGNALTFVCTGYTNTLSGSATLNVAGNVTFVAGMTITATGTLSITATATITSNGKVWTGNLGLSNVSGFTITFADDLYVIGTFSNLTTGTYIVNGNSLYVEGNVTFSAGSILQGTTNIRLNTSTTQTISTRTDTSNFRVDNLYFQATGTIVLSNNMYFGVNTTGINVAITYISGTMSMPSNVNIQANAGSGTTTLDTSGMTWGSLTFVGNGTVILASNLNTSGTVTRSGNTINGNTLNIGGGLTINAGTSQGTTNIVLNGTGAWSGAGTLRNNLTINTAGTITISGSVAFNTGTLTYTAGTVDASGSTLTIAASTTLNTNGITWNNVNISTVTVTNNSILTVNGLLTYISHAVVLNGSDVILNGGFTNNSNSACTGTATIKFKNTGTWVHTSGGSISNNIVFDSGVNTITLGAIVRYATGTITYTSGVIDATTNNSTLSIHVSCTLNTNGMSWNNILIVGGSLTLNSLLTATGTLTLPNSNTTFSGTAGFTVGTLTNTTLTAARTYTLASTKTYTITGAFTSNTNTSTIRPTFRSSTGGSQAILTLNAGATQNLKFVNATDINSSLGQQINSNKGTLSNATNWYRTNGTFMYLMQQ